MIKFDVEQLEQVLKKIYLLCHVKTSIFDDNLNEIIYFPRKYSDYCALIRSHKSGNRRCEKSDSDAIEIVKETLEPYKFICPHGLIEVFCPIIVDGVFVGLMTMGQVLPKDERAEALMETVSYLNLNHEDLKAAVDKLETISEDHLDASAMLVGLCAQFLWQNRLVNIVNDETAENIRKYIDSNITKKITAEVLCKEFYLSKISLYHIFSEYFNTSVAEYIRSKKLHLAKKIIEENPSMPIAEVADMVGIEANYLPKIFKKYFGYLPKKYQKRKTK